jgi:hypothetical protein
MAIQEQISLTGVGKDLDFGNPIEFVLDTHDVYPQNEGFLASVLDYDDNDHREVSAFVNLRIHRIANNIGAFGPIDSSEPGSDDPEIRAAAIIGHLGLPAEHAIYLPFFVNCDGEMLNGDRPEVFVFPYEPENVREFWSVTRYSLLTRNTLPGRNDVFNAYNTAPDAAGERDHHIQIRGPERRDVLDAGDRRRAVLFHCALLRPRPGRITSRTV